MMVMVAVTVDRVVDGMVVVRAVIGRVGTVGRTVRRRAVRIRGADRATGHMPFVIQVELAVLLLIKQLLQKSRVVVASVRRRG